MRLRIPAGGLRVGGFIWTAGEVVIHPGDEDKAEILILMGAEEISFHHPDAKSAKRESDSTVIDYRNR